MRVVIFIAAFTVLSAANAHAQVEMTVPEAGRVKTTAKVDNAYSVYPIPLRDRAEQRGNAWEPASIHRPQRPGFGYAVIPSAISIVRDETPSADAEYSQV
jgi:hypothetical protein